MSNDEHEQISKRLKIDKVEKYGSLIYQIPISENWLTIITSKAERFYYNSKTKQSVWQMPNYKETSDDIDLKSAYGYLEKNKDLLLCLLALVRGARLPWKVIVDSSTVLNLKLKERKENIGLNGEKASNESEQREMGTNNEHEDDIDHNDRGDNGQNDDDDDDDDGNEFALNLSDLDDLMGDSNHEDVHTNPIDRTKMWDPLISEYITKYSGLIKFPETELLNCIKFLKLLELLKIDVYSSYDLEIEDIIKNPQYIINNSNHLDDSTRRDLWDEYCRINGAIHVSDNSRSENTISPEMDTPELKYIQFLKSNRNEIKFPKFHTDFNRQMNKRSKTEGNQIYPDLCIEVPHAVRVGIYGKWVKWLKLSGDERIKLFDSARRKLTSSDMSNIDLLNLIKDKKFSEYYDCFFVDFDKDNKFI